MLIGIIADDLTGAGDVGLHFAKRGLRTIILIPSLLNNTKRLVRQINAGALILDTESRHDTPRLAYRKVRLATRILLSEFERGEGIFIYKKIDSTLRGNVGPEIDALLDEVRSKLGFRIGERKVPLVAAFPRMGRTTVNGWHYVYGKRLDKTVFANDPRASVTEAHIPALLRRTSQRWRCVRVYDCKFQKELSRIAKFIHQAVSSGNASFFVVASAGLAEEYAKLLAPKKVGRSHTALLASAVATSQIVADINADSRRYKRRCPQMNQRQSAPKKISGNQRLKNLRSSANEILVVCGSKHPVSCRQLSYLRKYFQKGSSTRATMVAPTIFDTTLEEGRPEAIMKSLVYKVVRFVRSRDIRRLILVGGETAFEISRRLEFKYLEILGAAETGIAVCQSKKHAIILKPGGFGDPNTLVKCVKVMRGL